jgi:NhaA family Na+:H+ antiporter
VNEILMAFFFGIATKEITESCLPGGALFPLNRAVNPLLGTLGGVMGPIVVYKAMVALLGAPEIAGGWGVPTATDIALAWLVARAVFGAKHPAVSYLLLLAVADDGIGLAIIAIFYPDPTHPTQPVWLALVALAMGLAWVFKRRGVLNPWVYVLVPGVLSWLGLAKAHMHPALALVPVVPFMPHALRDEGLFVESAGPDPVTDTMRRFEHAVKQPVDFGMFGFGLVNAGVAFTSIGPATWAVFAALLVGKTLGVSTLATLGDRLGFPIPEGMTPKSLVFAGLTAGLGLTVALFVAGAAFTDPTVQGAAKMGALFSIAAAPLAIAGGRLFGVERRSS